MLGITLAAFVALARPEGFLFVLAVLAFAYVVKRKARWFDVLPGLALGAIWALTATHYYGSPLPQSMLSKSALYAGEAWGGMKSSIAETYVLLSLGLPQSLVEGSKLRLLALLAVSLVLLWPFAVGVWRGYKEKSYPFVTGVFFALFVASYAVGKPVGITAWHAVPPAVLFLVTVCAGLGHTVRGRNTVLAIGGVAAAVCAASIVFGIARRQVKSDLYTANYMQLGQELRSRYPSGSAVMIGDIGIVGYVTGWKVIDTAGLVSPEVLKPRPDGRRPSLCALILDKRPDAICLKSDILHEGTTNESWIDYRTYDSAAERAAFLGEYERIEDLSPLYGSVYVKRELVAPH
jgi:hypothetical protein